MKKINKEVPDNSNDKKQTEHTVEDFMEIYKQLNDENKKLVEQRIMEEYIEQINNETESETD